MLRAAMSDSRRSTPSIYVQIDIRAPIDEVWRLSQTPDLHQQWDLRFTEIRYLPRADPKEAQRFLYATRIGFGLAIRGAGETVGSRESDAGQRSSALKFWSDDPKSLILVGSGYWKYVLVEDGRKTRFLTSYDYEVRFGAIGRALDRLVFRPLMGWATAWSFDRMRLWIEEGVPPAAALRHSLTHAVARLALAFVWLYQGVVPKLITPHRDELTLLRALGLGDSAARLAVAAIGWAEVVVALATLTAWRSRWPFVLTLFLMPLAIAAVALRSPAFLSAPFNPVTLNLAVFALAAVALLEMAQLPSARHCLRRAPAGKDESP